MAAARTRFGRTLAAMANPTRNMQHAIVRESRRGNEVESGPDASTWLAEAPRGAYTTARTVRSRAVFEFEAHVERLVASAKAMEAPPEAAINMEQRLRDAMASAVHAFERNNPGNDGEVRLTALLTWEGNENELLCHAGPLPPRPKQPVKVLVRGEPRSNAKAKDSEWVRDRKPLEDSKPKDVNEVILEGEDGSLYEGLSSNFFVVQDGTLYTAGKNILEGTVRLLTLEVCRKHGIPVKLEAPNIRDLEKWDGALISSTSRLLLPVMDLSAPDLDPPVHRTFAEDSMVFQLEELVLREIEAHSTPIFP